MQVCSERAIRCLDRRRESSECSFCSSINNRRWLSASSRIDRQLLKNNGVALAKAAKVLRDTDDHHDGGDRSFSGHTYPERFEVFPDQPLLERTSMNSWDDQTVREI